MIKNQATLIVRRNIYFSCPVRTESVTHCATNKLSMINLRSAFSLGIASLATIPSSGQKSVAFRQHTPNVILILMDDMGYGDNGRTEANQYETPNLNSLASQGVQFTYYYSPQAVSSASRAGLMTGCYPNRIGISGALMPRTKMGLSSEEKTIADILKQKSYHTSIIGKWHLGHLKQFLPLQHGFDEYYGIPYSNDMWPVDFDGVPIQLKDTSSTKMHYPVLPLIEGNEKVAEVRTLQDMDKITTNYTVKELLVLAEQARKDLGDYITKNPGTNRRKAGRID
jgi:hypothetical protein